MIETNLYNQKGDNIGKIKLPDSIFGLKLNMDLLYQVVTAQRANKRQIVAHAKGRSEVRGGGKKPWRQKGTGRARHGSIRSPLWKGGGVTFGPTKEKIYKKDINRKMARKALMVALASKLVDNNLFVVDAIKLEKPKTKEIFGIFKSISKNYPDKRMSNTLLVLPTNDKDFVRASGNLKNLDIIEARNLSTLDAVSYKNLLFAKESIEVLEKMLMKN